MSNIVRLKQYFIDTCIRCLMFFFLLPIVESTIDSIFHFYENCNLELYTIVKTIIKNTLPAYGDYIWGNKLYLLQSALIIFSITFVLSVLGRKLSIYDCLLFSKKMLLYLVILGGILLFSRAFNLDWLLVVFVTEIFTITLIRLYYRGYLKRIKTYFV